MLVDVLCRVVDNLGDIGFVYRLARALSELPDAPQLRIIVDDLEAFAGLCPGVRPAEGFQRVGNWQVSRWDDPGDEAIADYRSKRPRFVLECYACGRPDWFESILFDEADAQTRHIVNLEYLTAEPWASDFHLLPSLTRSPLVKKTVFMPGIRPGTGGLVIDETFGTLLRDCAAPERRLDVRRAALSRLRDVPSGTESAFWCLVFSYEHDFSSITADLAEFHACRPLVAFVAAGRSSACFLDAWERAGMPFPAIVLPLLEQTLWDSLLAASDFSVVRGEESFARACLAGRPFLWQCYPFAGEESSSGGQLPKVDAFLNTVKPHLGAECSAAYERLTLAFNGAERVGDSLVSRPHEPSPGDLLAVLRSFEGGQLTSGFVFLAQEARNLGNLAANLMTFLRNLG